MTNRAKMEMLRMETQASFPYLIEINTPDGTVYRYANSSYDKVFDGNTYEASVFSINHPEVKDGEVSDASIQISAVDLEWINKIRATQDRSEIRIVAAICRNEDGSETVEAIEERSFTLKSSGWNELAIDWGMVFDEYGEDQMPFDTCNRFVCPGA